MTPYPGHIRWQVQLLVMTGVFLTTMDSGMVNVALPTIMGSLQLSLPQAEFVITSYLLIITISLVFWGRLGDSKGLGRIYLIGIACFLCGSLCCGIAPNYYLLLGGRVVQATGGAMMMASGPALIRQVSPSKSIGQSLGLVGIATASGLLSGPMVSGLLLQACPWQSIFLVALVPGVPQALWATRLFRGRFRPQSGDGDLGKFDWQGSLYWTATIVSFFSLVHFLQDLNTLRPWGLGLLFICFTMLFLRQERKAERPILPLGLLEQRYYWSAVISAKLSFAALFAVMFLMPFYMGKVLELPVVQIGMVMMAVPATLVVLSPTSGWLFDRIGGRFLATAGLGISCVALVTLSTLGAESSIGELALMMAILGAGQSVFLSPNSASVLSQVPQQYLGITSGILATARNMGMLVGATGAALLFGALFSAFSGGVAFAQYHPGLLEATVAAQAWTLRVAALVTFIGCVISYKRVN